MDKLSKFISRNWKANKIKIRLFTRSKVNYLYFMILFFPKRIHTFIFRSLGQNLTDSELMGLISRVDSNRNGTIEFKEFLALVSSKKQVSFEEDMHKAFSLFDKVNMLQKNKFLF